MTPIEQVRPAQPGNWTRRPENRNKRGGQDDTRGSDPKDRDPKDKNRSGHDPGDDPGGREHIVDELA